MTHSELGRAQVAGTVVARTIPSPGNHDICVIVTTGAVLYVASLRLLIYLFLPNYGNSDF
jgi:hypothetical protein